MRTDTAPMINFNNKSPMNKFFELDWAAIGATVLAWILSFVSPIRTFIILVTGLVFADLLVGIMASISSGQENKVVSGGLRASIFKMGFYWIVIIISEGIVRTFSVPGFGLSPLTYMVSVLISYTEYKSIIEKVEQATGTQIWNFLKHNLPILAKIFGKDPDKPA